MFSNSFYFPTEKRISQYNKEIEDKLIDWLQNFFYKHFNIIIDTDVITTEEEKETLINFILDKTMELFKKTIKNTNNKVHLDTVRQLFLACFFITFKYYTAVDYEILYKNKNGKCFFGLNLKMLSKALPKIPEQKNIKILCKMEVDVLNYNNWYPFENENYLKTNV